ncbi:MAG: hypothetical protein QM692_19210 [Thermomicrobiales bacterium]
MRTRILALVMIVIFAPTTMARFALQDQTALGWLPTAASLGAGWSMLNADTAVVTDLPPALRDTAQAIYAGPNGARAYVLVILVAEGMTAIHDAWDFGNDTFERYRDLVDETSGAEVGLDNRPLPDGCTDGRRSFGRDGVLGASFLAGVSLCARSPDMIILAYVSGVVAGQTGDRASDHVVELALASHKDGTPAPTDSHFATPSPSAGATPDATLPTVMDNSTGPSLSSTPQTAAEATVVAQATLIAQLQTQQADAQVTATAQAVVAANSVLSPQSQNVTVRTDLSRMLAGNDDALQDARQSLSTVLSRYPTGCRAGFALISGSAPDIDQGIQLAQRIESLLGEVRPDIFTADTGYEQFAQPGVTPFGLASVTVFFYSGCVPIS